MSAVADRPVRAIFIRKAAKEHGTKSLIEGLAEGESLAGIEILVIEDVTTTGGSALKAIDALRAEGAKVAHVLPSWTGRRARRTRSPEKASTLHALFRKSEFAADI